VLPSYTYEGVQPGFAEHDLEEFDAVAAGLAWSRSLGVVRKAFGVDVESRLEGLREKQVQAAFGSKDADAIVRMMSKDAHLTNVPTLTGGIGQEELFLFYRDYFVLANPPSMAMKLLSRTIGVDRVVDELVLTFKHTQEMPWILPNVPATGKQVEVALASVVCVRGGKPVSEHMYWDQASVLVQIGLLDPALMPPAMKAKGIERLPVMGAEAARRVLDVKSEPSNELILGWRDRQQSDIGVQMPMRPKQAMAGSET
jgi:hypothetical protein